MGLPTRSTHLPAMLIRPHSPSTVVAARVVTAFALAGLGLIPSCFAAAALPAQAPTQATRAQTAEAEAWHGTVWLGERRVQVGVTLHRTLHGTAADLWLPDQGLRGVPLQLVQPTITAPKMTMPTVTAPSEPLDVQLAHWPGQPQLRLSRVGTGTAQTLTGTFRQGGFSSPLTLWRGPVTFPPRPQEPQPPPTEKPYQEREVRILGAGGTPLRGTLTLPVGSGPFPAAVLVSGSGPQDRDSTLHGHRPFLVLADFLARQGIASLRLDDRGVGGSEGDLYAAHYSDLSRDLQAAVTFLRGHPAVRGDQVGFIGHSEGGSLAALSATQLQPPPAFAVLLGSPAISGRELLALQLRSQLVARGLSSAEITARAEAQALALGGQRPQLEQLPLSGSELEQAWLHARPFRRSPYLQDFLSYDPQPALQSLQAQHVPTLAVFGSLDLQVPPSAGAQPLRALLTGRGSAVHELSGLNHLLQPAHTGLPEEYAEIPTTLDPSVLQLLERWLEQTLQVGISHP